MKPLVAIDGLFDRYKAHSRDDHRPAIVLKT
jgi:hypothetical protein